MNWRKSYADCFHWEDFADVDAENEEAEETAERFAEGEREREILAREDASPRQAPPG